MKFYLLLITIAASFVSTQAKSPKELGQSYISFLQDVLQPKAGKEVDFDAQMNDLFSSDFVMVMNNCESFSKDGYKDFLLSARAFGYSDKAEIIFEPIVFFDGTGCIVEISCNESDGSSGTLLIRIECDGEKIRRACCFAAIKSFGSNLPSGSWE